MGHPGVPVVLPALLHHGDHIPFSSPHVRGWAGAGSTPPCPGGAPSTLSSASGSPYTGGHSPAPASLSPQTSLVSLVVVVVAEGGSPVLSGTGGDIRDGVTPHLLMAARCHQPALPTCLSPWPHWETSPWRDGEAAGKLRHRSLGVTTRPVNKSTPYHITGPHGHPWLLTPGKKNKLGGIHGKGEGGVDPSGGGGGAKVG